MRKEKLRALILAQTFLALSLGLIGPIYSIYFEEITNNTALVPILIGIYWIIIGILEPIFGHYIDKIGKARSFLIGSAIEATSILLYPLANNVIVLVLAEILAAIGYSIQTPSSYALMADLTDKRSRGKEIGKIDGMFNVAYGISAIISAGILSLFGFNYLFIIAATIYILSGIIVLNSVREI